MHDSYWQDIFSTLSTTILINKKVKRGREGLQVRLSRCCHFVLHILVKIRAKIKSYSDDLSWSCNCIEAISRLKVGASTSTGIVFESVRANVGDLCTIAWAVHGNGLTCVRNLVWEKSRGEKTEILLIFLKHINSIFIMFISVQILSAQFPSFQCCCFFVLLFFVLFSLFIFQVQYHIQ